MKVSSSVEYYGKGDWEPFVEKIENIRVNLHAAPYKINVSAGGLKQRFISLKFRRPYRFCFDSTLYPQTHPIPARSFTFQLWCFNQLSISIVRSRKTLFELQLQHGIFTD